VAKHAEHRCRRWWAEGLECPFLAMPDHEDDEKDEVTSDEHAKPMAHIRQVSMQQSVPVAVLKQKAAVDARAAEAEVPVTAISGGKLVSAVALSVLVATAAHLASGRQGPGKGSFRAAEIMAAKTAGRFARSTGGRGGGGGFHFEVQDFKKAVTRRKLRPGVSNRGPGPFTGGYQGV